MPTADQPAEKRIKAIVRILKKTYGEETTALVWKTPLEMLVATILSAQTTDERVNLVTEELFARYRSAQDFARASQAALEKAVTSTGFFRNKARSIKGTGQKLESDFGGEVPRTMEELLTLPGVARKTANVVLGTCFGIASGVVVDTHVKRVSGRLGLTKHTDPVKIERDLCAIVPKREWVDFGHRVIWHGRRICPARKPRCEECPLAKYCPFPTDQSGPP